jgi:hypothetical protein
MEVLEQGLRHTSSSIRLWQQFVDEVAAGPMPADHIRGYVLYHFHRSSISHLISYALHCNRNKIIIIMSVRMLLFVFVGPFVIPVHSIHYSSSTRYQLTSSGT